MIVAVPVAFNISPSNIFKNVSFSVVNGSCVCSSEAYGLTLPMLRLLSSNAQVHKDF